MVFRWYFVHSISLILVDIFKDSQTRYGWSIIFFYEVFLVELVEISILLWFVEIFSVYRWHFIYFISLTLVKKNNIHMVHFISILFVQLNDMLIFFDKVPLMVIIKENTMNKVILLKMDYLMDMRYVYLISTEMVIWINFWFFISWYFWWMPWRFILFNLWRGILWCHRWWFWPIYCC